MIKELNHIGLNTGDVEKSIDFYVNTLGMTIRTTWGGVGSRAALLAIGDGSHIELFEGGDDDKTEPPMQAGEWFHLALRTEDPDGAFAKAVAWGARPKLEPKSAQIGDLPIRIAFVYGPSNEVIEFFKEG